jgi:hypothetical protein
VIGNLKEAKDKLMIRRTETRYKAYAEGKRALDCKAQWLDVNSGGKSCGLSGKGNEFTVGGL